MVILEKVKLFGRNEMRNAKEKKDSKSSSRKGKPRDGGAIEEFIDSESPQSKGNEREQEEPDKMGISEKAKNQPSDERDVSKGK